ncbi:hypothetical protein TNCV_4971821 [Trichonephila clavipes]|nr:hypothetical protein TNCV_4971821 [Trichonephila clavipes]
MIPAYNKKRCAAFPFETGIHFRRKTAFFPEEVTQPSLTRDSNPNPFGYKPKHLRNDEYQEKHALLCEEFSSHGYYKLVPQGPINLGGGVLNLGGINLKLWKWGFGNEKSHTRYESFLVNFPSAFLKYLRRGEETGR